MGSINKWVIYYIHVKIKQIHTIYVFLTIYLITLVIRLFEDQKLKAM
jgi:hypothetical protein